MWRCGLLDSLSGQSSARLECVWTTKALSGYRGRADSAIPRNTSTARSLTPLTPHIAMFPHLPHLPSHLPLPTQMSKESRCPISATHPHIPDIPPYSQHASILQCLFGLPTHTGRHMAHNHCMPTCRHGQSNRLRMHASWVDLILAGVCVGGECVCVPCDGVGHGPHMHRLGHAWLASHRATNAPAPPPPADPASAAPSSPNASPRWAGTPR